jgi:hypothetical protein
MSKILSLLFTLAALSVQAQAIRDLPTTTALAVGDMFPVENAREAQFKYYGWQILNFVSNNIPAIAAGLASTDIDTSAEIKAIVGDETGSGVLVFATSPTLVTPTLGVASFTSANKVAFTAPATSATVTIADGKTFTANQTTTLDRQSSTGLPVEWCIAASDETTAITTGTAKVQFRAPYAFTLTDLRVGVNTAPTGSTILVDLKESGTTVLSTRVMVDASESTSTTAATPYVISDPAIADDAVLSVNFDQVGSSVAGAGLKLWIKGYR